MFNVTKAGSLAKLTAWMFVLALILSAVTSQFKAFVGIMCSTFFLFGVIAGVCAIIAKYKQS